MSVSKIAEKGERFLAIAKRNFLFLAHTPVPTYFQKYEIFRIIEKEFSQFD